MDPEQYKAQMISVMEASDAEFCEAAANLARRMYDAYRKAGFTSEEAMTLLASKSSSAGLR